MTDNEFEELVRRALKENLRAEFPDVFDPDMEFPRPDFSPRYLRRERKLLSDPVGYARRQARPVWQKALQTAACLVLCCTVLFAAVMAGSPSARAWVMERTVRWTEQFTEFTFISRDPKGVTEDWRPAYIPEGFVETQAKWDGDMEHLQVTYETDYGYYFILSSMPARQSGSFNVDNEHSDYSEVEVNGHTASLFTSNTEGAPTYLLWTSADQSTAFLMASNLDVDEILRIAEDTPKK
ncbi:hypothetical protein CE91St41_00990 [Oscillospiraceae bacterium]|nr:hypothetical protein CE91St40_00990 [Oscillospiraceae bacterium]BDF73210.1 hypothetical protein CE91St41_00990 [Oscillospiraceae bacterium]